MAIRMRAIPRKLTVQYDLFDLNTNRDKNVTVITPVGPVRFWDNLFHAAHPKKGPRNRYVESYERSRPRKFETSTKIIRALNGVIKACAIAAQDGVPENCIPVAYIAQDMLRKTFKLEPDNSEPMWNRIG